jgi:hypothetical protein
MLTRLIEDVDADRIENLVTVTDYMTDQNKYEISCGTCFKTLYADRQTSEGLLRSIEQGLDNPFMCNDCQLELEEEAYETRR